MCIIILSAHLVYSYFKYRYNIIYKVKLNNYLFFGGACQQGLLFVFLAWRSSWLAVLIYNKGVDRKMEFVLYLTLIILFTKVAGDLSVRLGQPAVLGKLIVGIILGPAVLGWVQDGEFIHYISEIGVLLLMFIAGLETDLDQLRKNWKSALQ